MEVFLVSPRSVQMGHPGTTKWPRQATIRKKWNLRQRSTTCGTQWRAKRGVHIEEVVNDALLQIKGTTGLYNNALASPPFYPLCFESYVWHCRQTHHQTADPQNETECVYTRTRVHNMFLRLAGKYVTRTTRTNNDSAYIERIGNHDCKIIVFWNGPFSLYNYILN